MKPRVSSTRYISFCNSFMASWHPDCCSSMRSETSRIFAETSLICKRNSLFDDCVCATMACACLICSDFWRASFRSGDDAARQSLWWSTSFDSAFVTWAEDWTLMLSTKSRIWAPQPAPLPPSVALRGTPGTGSGSQAVGGKSLAGVTQPRGKPPAVAVLARLPARPRSSWQARPLVSVATSAPRLFESARCNRADRCTATRAVWKSTLLSFRGLHATSAELPWHEATICSNTLSQRSATNVAL
mmetsp:Transcript_75882/g.217196  ORF Transcript_75882/g.217196 Transcript_75882/m.217196 type:complete len:244 (+) Transcript_75882:1300-2031(+)